MHGGTTQESTPQGHAPLRAGSVIGERYEVIRQLDQDPLSALYECRDHEDERLVWVRLASPALCPDPETARSYAARLAPAVGARGPHLTGLLGVDLHQGATLFVVEPAAAGTSLSALLLGRSESRMNADELLPIMAQLAQALDACPTGRHHGEVRLERVFVDDAGQVQLTGAFLVAAAPPRLLATVLRAHDRLRREFAPEALTGVARDSADLFGAGQVALQALTGERACEPGATVPARLGGVGDEIAKLVAAHPRRRPPSLTPLLEALARQAGAPAPVPTGEADADDSDDFDDGAGATAVVRHPHPSSHPPGAAAASAGRSAPLSGHNARRPVGADASGTAELALEDLQFMDRTPNPSAGGDAPASSAPDDHEDDDVGELDEDAKTRQVKLAEIRPSAGAGSASALSDAGAHASPHASADDDDDDDDDDDGPRPPRPGEATVKIAFADIKPPTAPRTKQGPATLITRVPASDANAAPNGGAARPAPARKRRRSVVVPALVAAVVIVAASLMFALYRQWRAEQDQHERVREHIEHMQQEEPAPAPAAPAGD